MRIKFSCHSDVGVGHLFSFSFFCFLFLCHFDADVSFRILMPKVSLPTFVDGGEGGAGAVGWGGGFNRVDGVHERGRCYG